MSLAICSNAAWRLTSMNVPKEPHVNSYPKLLTETMEFYTGGSPRWPHAQHPHAPSTHSHPIVHSGAKCTATACTVHAHSNRVHRSPHMPYI